MTRTDGVPAVLSPRPPTGRRSGAGHAGGDGVGQAAEDGAVVTVVVVVVVVVVVDLL